jgi:hypothetical protein
VKLFGAALIVVGVFCILLNGTFARGTMGLQAKLGMEIYPNQVWARAALIVIGLAWIAGGIHLFTSPA